MASGYTYVILASGRHDVRKELEQTLARLPEILVVAEASDGDELETKAQELSPHVVLMDIALPGKNGIETIRALKQKNPKIKVLVVASSESIGFVSATLKVGASGYCLFGSSPELLEAAIRSVSLGAIWLDGKISPALVDRIAAALAPQRESMPKKKLG